VPAVNDLSPAAKTYVRVTSVAMSLYVLALLQWGMTAGFGVATPEVLARALVALTSLAIVVHLWALLRVVRLSDEFMRTVMAKRLLTAAVIVIGCATIWSLGHNVGWVGVFPLPLIYLAFFVVHAALIPFINAGRA
jgi:hypothetical protein